MADVAETKGIIDTFRDIGSAIGTVWSVIKGILGAPLAISGWITTNMKDLLPEWLQFDIHPAVALLLGLITTLLLSRYLSKLTQYFGSSLLGLGAKAYMYYGLYRGCRAIVALGWVQALLMLALVMTICLPGYGKYWVAIGHYIYAFFKWILPKAWDISKFFGRLGIRAASKALEKDPLAQGIIKSLGALRKRCAGNNREFQKISAAFQARLNKEYGMEAEERVEAAIAHFKLKNGIAVVELSPMAKLFCHDLLSEARSVA